MFENLKNSLIFGDWWNPWSWGEDLGNMVAGMMEAIQNMINGLLVGMVQKSLELVNMMFNTSVNALRSEVVMTPAQFDINLVGTLESITKTAILPIAGILITYMFAYEIYEMFTAHNKGGEVGTGDLLFLFIKTFVMIMLATHAFTISMAFSDLSSWIVQKVPESSTQISVDLTEIIVEELKPVVIDDQGNIRNDIATENFTADQRKAGYYIDFKLGTATVVALISVIAIVVTMIMAGIMYLVAWSRMIMILVYVTVSPIPMATLMNLSWFGSIGQNYVKNLMALMLQGFMMLVLLIIYSGLMNRIKDIVLNSLDPIYGMMMLIVSMAIIVSMLLKTHDLSKSIMGAS